MGAFPAKMSIVEKLFALTFAMIAVGVRAAITEIPSSGGYVYKYLFSAFRNDAFSLLSNFLSFTAAKKESERQTRKTSKRRMLLFFLSVALSIDSNFSLCRCLSRAKLENQKVK